MNVDYLIVVSNGSDPLRWHITDQQTLQQTGMQLHFCGSSGAAVALWLLPAC